MTAAIAPDHCARLHGGSVRECVCMMLPHDREAGGGFLDCPPEARGILGRRRNRVATHAAPPSLAGEFCHSCGSPSMIRTGTCLTCASCGDSSGGCS